MSNDEIKDETVTEDEEESTGKEGSVSDEEVTDETDKETE